MLTAMLLPGNWDDRRAVQTLALSTGGGVLLGDQGYSGEETFDWLYEKAQTLRVMPSDEDPMRTKKDFRPSVRCASGSKVAYRACGADLPIEFISGHGADCGQVCC